MRNQNHCLHCGANLINRRSHAKHCSNACRAKSWRQNQVVTVPLKLAFDVTHFEMFTNEAARLGISVKSVIMSKALGVPPTCN